MSGRKTIMVDGGVWNKVEELKHDACLRSSGDAIESAVDIASSDKYYAGIKAQLDGFGLVAYVVESLGRTEDEAIRDLLVFEQGSVLGDLRAEDIPPADDVDISEPGRFIVECTPRLYHAGKLFADPKYWNKSLGFGLPKYLFTCTISKSKNGSFMADSEETCAEEYKTGNRYFVLVQLMEDERIARIVDYGTSPIELHNEMLYHVVIDDEPGEAYEKYNMCRYQIYPCTPRLYAECIGMTFQSRLDLDLMAEGIIDYDEEPTYQAFYGSVQYRKNEKTGKEEAYIDTTPEGHYYALLIDFPEQVQSGSCAAIFNAGETANKAAETFTSRTPAISEGLGDYGYWFKNQIPVWFEVKKNGERIGKYEYKEGLVANLHLIECTKEVYCKFILAEKDVLTFCKIEEENGVKIAKYVDPKEVKKDIAEHAPDTKAVEKKSPAKKTAAAKSTQAKKSPAKKTGGKK